MKHIHRGGDAEVSAANLQLCHRHLTTSAHCSKILHHLLRAICVYSRPQNRPQVGGLAERPLSGAVVGPTFGCLLGQQFQILKKGDR